MNPYGIGVMDNPVEDDIRNLLLPHEACNLKKSNQYPDEQELKNLQERNVALLKRMQEKGFP